MAEVRRWRAAADADRGPAGLVSGSGASLLAFSGAVDASTFRGDVLTLLSPRTLREGLGGVAEAS